jgi:hypothetical protein
MNTKILNKSFIYWVSTQLDPTIILKQDTRRQEVG